MGIRHIEHVGIVVDDFDEAIRFFTALGFESDGEGPVEGDWVGRIIGLEHVRADIAILKTPDGLCKLELVKFNSPRYEGGEGTEPSNAPGLRHILFAVDDIEASVAVVREQGFDLIGELYEYESTYKLCYVRGPAGIIVELAEKLP
ncbi:MAG: VOC family protein [Thermoleophilaceae bacterium]|nr:VOC family protein [Thermoleophilaceae bacterium]